MEGGVGEVWRKSQTLNEPLQVDAVLVSFRFVSVRFVATGEP